MTVYTVRISVFAVTVVALTGCTSGRSTTGTSGRDSSSPANTAPVAVAEGASGIVTPGADRSVSAPVSPAQLLDAGHSVIRTAELDLHVADVLAAGAEVVTLASNAGGFLSSETSSLGDEASSQIVVKVPPTAFGSVMGDLAALGDVVAQRVGSDDVTATVVDLEGRLGAARVSAQRLLELLGDADDVTQVVAVESELARRESEVESLAGQLRSLESQVDLATITVNLSEPSVALSPEVSDDIPGFARGFDIGWVALVTAVGMAATVAGVAAPFAVVAATMGLPTLALVRRRRRPRRTTAPR